MDKPTMYQIRIKGHLDDALAGWFEEMAVSNLGLTLVSVNAVPEED